MTAPGKPSDRSPDRAVRRRRDGVERAADPLVLGRDRPAGSGSTYASRLPLPLVSMMSAVQPCDFTSSLRLLEHLRVQPADHLAAAARPQRVVRVLGEHQVVRAEAGADVRQLLRLRIVDREVAAGIARSGTASPTDGSSPPCRSRDCRGGRTADVIHTRPFSSSIGLCTLFLLVQIASSPQYGDGSGIAGVRRRRVRIADRQRHLADACGAPDRAPAGSRRSARARRRSGRWR